MLTVNELYDLSHSLAGDYLKQFTYPWEALAGISDLILEIGKQLPEDEYVHPTDWDGNVLEDVWVAKDATVFKTAYLHGPCIIGHRTEVRQQGLDQLHQRRQQRHDDAVDDLQGNLQQRGDDRQQRGDQVRQHRQHSRDDLRQHREHGGKDAGDRR